MTPFHKVYVNPALGYWKDESKVELIPILPFQYTPTQDDLVDATKLAMYACLGVDLAKPNGINQELYSFGFPSLAPPDHLCLGSRCLICEATRL